MPRKQFLSSCWRKIDERHVVLKSAGQPDQSNWNSLRVFNKPLLHWEEGWDERESKFMIVVVPQGNGLHPNPLPEGEGTP